MVYIKLFHGRDTIDEQMQDWGYEGPTIGPFPYVHTTYASDIKCGENTVFKVINDLFEYEGKYYGDWSVTSTNKERKHD